MFERIRAASAHVAAHARFVRLAGDPVAYAHGFDLEALRRPVYDTKIHLGGDDDDARLAYVLVLNAINFGSGYFPRLRKAPGRSGYTTVAQALTSWFVAAGTPTPQALRELDDGAMAELLGQDLDDPLRARLMTLYAAGLRDLGSLLRERFGSRYDALVHAAGRSAERLAVLLAEMPLYGDVWSHDGVEVPFYKRAQITASDLALAFGGTGPGAFGDLEELTIFADNLVPHVLRVDGVVAYAPELARRIDAGYRLEAGSPEEVEIRAVALDTVERMVSGMRAEGLRVCARDFDIALWNRGQAPSYRRRARHRTLTTSY